MPLTGPAIATLKSKAAPGIVQRGMKPSDDNRPVEEPAAIVTIRKPRGRKAAWTDDDGETPESVNAFLARRSGPAGKRRAIPRGATGYPNGSWAERHLQQDPSLRDPFKSSD